MQACDCVGGRCGKTRGRVERLVGNGLRGFAQRLLVIGGQLGIACASPTFQQLRAGFQRVLRIVADLEAKGLAEKIAGDLDGRRRAVSLTPAGAAFEDRISERLRAQLARSYRVGGLDGVAGARQILSALAGGRMKSGGA